MAVLTGECVVGAGSDTVPKVVSDESTWVSGDGSCAVEIGSACWAGMDVAEREETVRDARGLEDLEVGLALDLADDLVVDLADGRGDFTGEAAFLERRGTRPSIDLFFSIVIIIT